MKKNLLTSITGTSLFLVTCIAANGQIASTNMQPSGDFASLEKSATRIESNKVSQKAIKDLAKTFKNVSGEMWFQAQKGFVAMFNLDNIDYQVAYDKKGNWVRSIRSYSEAKLSEDVRHIVKSTYYDYTINRVQEIDKPIDAVTYVIQLTGKTELINLSVTDGEMLILRKFKKSE